MKKVKLFEEYIQEATTSWGKMMKGVKAGDGGPWSIVAIEYNKVVGQSIDIKIRDLIPAKYEALKAEFPRAKFHIEDGGGQVVWNESFINEGIDSMVKKLETMVNKQFNVIEFKAPAKRPMSNEEFLMIKVSDDKYGGPQSGLGKFIKRWTGVESSFVDSLGSNKTYWISLEELENSDVLESFINEAKDSTRDELMNLLETKYKLKTVRTSEEFNGQTEGIWIAGDNGEELGGNPIFDYYSNSAKYANGVLKQFRTAVEKTGWWLEWNDPGTLMIWPKN